MRQVHKIQKVSALTKYQNWSESPGFMLFDMHL